MQRHTLDLEPRQGARLDTLKTQRCNGTADSSTLSERLNELKSFMVRGFRSGHSKKRRITLATGAFG